MAYTHLDPGRELEISTRVYYYSHQIDISELVKLTPEQLNEREEASVEQEKAIYEKMLEMEKAWGRQAGCTMALRNAREYLRTPPTKHTSNQWVAGEYGWHEMSNMVYKFTWHIYENTSWSRAEQKSVIRSYDLSWYLTYNTTNKPDYTGPGRQLAGQERKHFADKASLDKYLQGRIKAYSHLFTEISPPIPEDQKGRFCVNGVLLPGYTVAVPERTPQEVADDLLDFLEDGDVAAQPSVPEEEKPPPTPSRPASKKATACKPRKHVPER